MAKLTVLSFGAGQDSTTILDKCVYDPSFRKEYAPGDLIVVMADTGNEHDQTYRHVEDMRELCKKHDIPFFLITPDMGHHSKTWPSLQHQWKLNKSVGSKAFMKSCTDKLKIGPIYNFVGSYIHKTYGLDKHGRKQEFIEFARKYGKIDVLIGIAKGEEKRVAGENKSDPKWRRQSINVRYPLIDLGMDRQECQDYISSLGQLIPIPSNCKMCPWTSLQELLWLYRFDKAAYIKWTWFEAAKINHWEGRTDKNVGVWGGTVLLPAKLKEAKKLYGHWSDKKLHAYKMSHGHCVMSKY